MGVGLSICLIAAETGEHLRPGLWPGWEQEAGMRLKRLRERVEPEERVALRRVVEIMLVQHGSLRWGSRGSSGEGTQKQTGPNW